MAQRVGLAVLLVAVLPVVLGLVGAFGDTLSVDGPGEGSNPAEATFATIGNRPSTWVILAFAAGVVAGGWFRAPVFSTAAMLVAIVTYYVAIEVFELRPGVDTSSLEEAGKVWAVAALGAGLVYGPAGLAWRRRVMPGVAVGLVLAVLFFELWLWLDSGDALLTLVTGATILALLALVARPPRELALALATGILLAGAVGLVVGYFVEAARYAR